MKKIVRVVLPVWLSSAPSWVRRARSGERYVRSLKDARLVRDLAPIGQRGLGWSVTVVRADGRSTALI